MSRVPKEVVEAFHPGRLEKVSSGDSATTFIGEKVVVQAREKSWLPYGELLYRMSQKMLLPGLNFLARPLVHGRRVWTVQKRLTALRPIYPASDALNLAQISSRPVFAQLDYLANVGPKEKLAKLPESKSTQLQMMSARDLKDWAKEECPLAGNPARHLSDDEPESEIVFSHGDPSIKNTLLTPFGPALIDFEAIALLPRHKDYTHMSAFLIKRCRGDSLMIYWPEAKKRLPDWSGDDWRQAVLIYLLRELLAWPIEDEKEQLLAWRRFAQLAKG